MYLNYICIFLNHHIFLKLCCLLGPKYQQHGFLLCSKCLYHIFVLGSKAQQKKHGLLVFKAQQKPVPLDLEHKKKLLLVLEDTARYTGLLLAPAEAFFVLWANNDLINIMLFWPIFGHFWFPVVTLVTFSNNLIIFVRDP